MSAYKMTRTEIVKNNAQRMLDLLNKYGIFSSNVEVDITKPIDRKTGEPVKYASFILNIKLDANNHAYSAYFINDNGNLVGYVYGVDSSVGNKIGSFLLQLHLLLMVISDVTTLSLANFTDDPARAARGVYSDFRVIKKGEPEKWKGKDLAEQLHMAEGEMIYKPTAESREIIEQKMRDIVAEQKAKGQPLPFWNNYDNIDKFIRDLRQSVGGKKHCQQSRKKRCSLNKKHKRRKSKSKTRRYRK